MRFMFIVLWENPWFAGNSVFSNPYFPTWSVSGMWGSGDNIDNECKETCPHGKQG